MSSSTWITNELFGSGPAGSPSKSSAVMTELKSMNRLFSLSPESWSSGPSRSNTQLPSALTVSVKTVEPPAEAVSTLPTTL